MIFEPTALPGAFLIRPEPHRDARGFFVRLFCPEECAAAGLDFTNVQINLSRNPVRHTLRGLHFQAAPHAEAKIVRVTRGAIHDVIVDLRPGSPTRLRHAAFRLDAEGAEALFVPEGFAHGFLTLEPETDVLYQMGRAHVPGQARGYRYDDPAFAIAWPAPPALIGPADLAWPAFPANP
ncbi:MAG: dTDP-4-dehydrorhamnose 3,5-epimerase family protein [Hyphomicrobiales bacterium]|nr:dTDP-4-dehydrorhamnose 3,5-epimerase family protein [Hyphomicrobiales bacterium]MCA1998528.1 dTDP-4-dehydrorhamnose 3,5-epimerase family protein [Hyphomicrobiales bacterium]